MKVELAYGHNRLEVALPGDRTTVVTPTFRPAAPDPAAELRRALRDPVAGPPLSRLARRGAKVAIAVCDVTRPQPRQLMLQAVLDELEPVVRREDVSVLVATGTHRSSTPAELLAMFGEELLGSLRVVDHDARDESSLAWVGTLGQAVPVWLSAEWLAADLRITTGFVEPHFFAGFSGGPKLVAPGLAGLETVLHLHDARRIGDARATWGVIEGNPVHDDVRAIAAATGVHFALDVVLNRDQAVVEAFGGELFAMHAAACARARQVAMRAVGQPFEVVVTTNAGYPLDQNLYQSVKGMSAAAEVVRPGGLVVCATRCADGFGDHGSYRAMLKTAGGPTDILASLAARTETEPDQWQVQVQARVQAKADVMVYTEGISDDELAEVHLGATHDIASSVKRALCAAGHDARVCVLPEGPQTIPYCAG